MSLKAYMLFIFLFSACLKLTAQQVQKNGQITAPKNMIKVNLPGIVLNNYSIQYERVMSRHLSLAVSGRLMPSASIPFKEEIIKAADEDDPDVIDAIEKVRLGNFALTPELRLYLSKRGYGRGFYIAPFYRYASFDVDGLYFSNHGISLSGNIKANTGGIMFGAQWPLGKHFCLDWWIIGPHIGAGKGTVSGTSKTPLSQQEQDELRNELENLDMPYTEKTVSVTATTASLKINGPWAGVRAGLSLGVRF